MTIQSHYHGAILIDGGSQAGFTQTADTLQCQHCGNHWVVRPGSGIQRGWCRNCQGPTCGARLCDTDCNPWEQQMEAMESRARIDEAIARTAAL